MPQETTRRAAVLQAAALLPTTTLLLPAAARAVTRRPDTTTARFRALERAYGARLGVFAAHDGPRSPVAFRADERFAFCSTYKALAAAAILRTHAIPSLERVVRYSAADLVDHSPVTGLHVDTGMTLRALCEAATSVSDNTAGNLVIRELGGPRGLTAALRRVGDRTTISSRYETELNDAVPGDPRDTSTPRALAFDLARFAVGTALPVPRRDLLNRWLVGNTTGATLVRAAVPAGWGVGDRSGGGAYGTRNDIAVLRPPDAPAIVLSVLSTRPQQDAAYDDRLIAGAAGIAISALTA